MALIPQVRGSWRIVCHLAALIYWPTQCLTHCGSENFTFEAREKRFGTRRTQDRISSQSKPHKGRKGERRRLWVILMNIWQGFFFTLLSTACLILIKIHPSLMSFIELTGDIFSTHWPWETNLSIQLLENVNSEALNFRQILIVFTQINEKSVTKKISKIFSLKRPLQSSAALGKMLVSRSQATLVYFLPAIFISLFTCCSVSIYPWWGLLLGRSDHFQQQAPRIRATCHIIPVTTNDYQCIWAERQRAGLGNSRGWREEGGVGVGGRRWWRWGLHAPRRQRFSSHVAALKPHITFPQSTKFHTYVPHIDPLRETGWYWMSGGRPSEESQ